MNGKVSEVSVGWIYFDATDSDCGRIDTVRSLETVIGLASDE